MTRKNIFLIILFLFIEISLQIPCVKRNPREPSRMIGSWTYHKPTPAIQSQYGGSHTFPDYQRRHQQHNFEKEPQVPINTFDNTLKEFERHKDSFRFRHPMQQDQQYQHNEGIIQRQGPYNNHVTRHQNFGDNWNQKPKNTRFINNQGSRRKPEQSDPWSNNSPDYHSFSDRPIWTFQPYNTDVMDHLSPKPTVRNSSRKISRDSMEDKVNTNTNDTIKFDNRDSFNGGCAYGYVRVNGVCVIPD